MRFLFISALLLMLGVSTASGAKMTKISGAKTDGQTILCNQYIGQDAKAHHEAIKKLDEKLSNKLEAIIKLLQGQAASTCKEIYDKNLHKGNKAYLLEVGSVKIPVYCHMTSTGLGACGGGGWTLVMKIDGTKKTFHYNSKLWSNKNEYNIFPGGKTGLDSQETKLPTYWKTPFSKICLGMKIGTQIKFIVINKQANSLYSLIADGKYRATSLARNTWKKLIGSGASLQRNCNKQGFNTECNSNNSKARIGFVGNNGNDCKSCDSRIGFGTGGYPQHSDTCGNVAKHGGDNGDKLIKTMGYILVQ